MDQILSAPAKIILLGEHAVVYGKPALAVPVSTLRAYAEIIPLPLGAGLKITAVDLDNQEFLIGSVATPTDHPLVSAAWLLLNHLKINPPNVNVVLHSDIPIASGMGSGAAITTALLRAISYALGKSLSEDEINDLVYKVEKLYHGTPSGVDNTVIVFEQPIYFVKDEKMEHLKIAHSFTLLIADTGVGASTKLAVADVRDLYNANERFTNQILDAIANLVAIGRNALGSGDIIALGSVMNENHELLQKLTVSSPLLDSLVSVAQSSGSLGAKLSGGGRGGNMIALVAEDRAEFIKRKLLEAGAVKVYQTVVA